MLKYISDLNIEEELPFLKNEFFIYYKSKHLSLENLEKIKPFHPREIDEDEVINLYYLQNKKNIKVIVSVDSEVGLYRRDKLINYLYNKFGEESVLVVRFLEFNIEKNRIFLNNVLKNDKPLVIFTYQNSKLLKICEENLYNTIMYDKYDFYDCYDENLIEKVKLVTASSYNLIESIKKEEKYYIPNGCDVVEYKPVEKYKQKTAIYTGYNLRKVDFNVMALLKAVNPDWNIKIYGNEKLIEELELKEKYPDLEFCGFLQQDKLVEELSKCHIGLNFIEYDEITKGQLSDKFFNYCNAHIPTLIYEEFQDNYKDYKNLIKVFDFSELELDKYIENLPTDEEYEEVLKDCDWKNRFDKMFEIIKEKNLI